MGSSNRSLGSPRYARPNVSYWHERTEIRIGKLLRLIGLSASKHHQWKRRYGKADAHNGKVPLDWWLQAWEKRAIVDFYLITVLDGYSRYIIHHELRQSMTELDVEIVCQAALEKHLVSNHGSSAITVRSSLPRASRHSLATVA